MSGARARDPARDAAQAPAAEAAGDGFTETMVLERAATRCVLRVLTGDHAGAESEIVSDRVLIGNLEHECDIVLDVKSQGRHACLVRVSDDGWTVLAIAGELWLDEAYIAPQQTCMLRPGQVLTLGRVALCLADPDTIDWAQVRVPRELAKPEVEGPVPHAPLLPNPTAMRRRWQALKLVAGLGTGGLVLVSAAAYLSQAWVVRDIGPQAEAARLQADRALVGSLPFTREVSVIPHPEQPRKLLLQGYVPERQQLALLDTTLQRIGTTAELRVHAVDALGDELGRRFDGMLRQQVRYEQQGRYELETALERLPLHDRQARVTLQEMPAINGLALKTVDVQGPDGKPVVVRYERSSERPGDLVVSHLDDALGRKPVKVLEVRLGELPSVVLEDGMRYFVDARLPDGSTIASIDAQRLVLRFPSGSEREVAFERVSITSPKGPYRSSRN
jgi:hypothetical protein